MYRHTLRQNRQKLPRSHTPRSSNNLAHLMTRPKLLSVLFSGFDIASSQPAVTEKPTSLRRNSW
jgi:hypothetical protein